MPVQFSVRVRNARLDVIETTTGASPKLRIYSGAMPVNCAAAPTGTLIEIPLSPEVITTRTTLSTIREQALQSQVARG